MVYETGERRLNEILTIVEREGKGHFPDVDGVLVGAWGCNTGRDEGAMIRKIMSYLLACRVNKKILTMSMYREILGGN